MRLKALDCFAMLAMTVIARSEATKQSKKATFKDQPLPTIIPEAPQIFTDLYII
jgi:hypothetical protein